MTSYANKKRSTLRSAASALPSTTTPGYDEDGNYIPDLVYDGVGFVPAEVAAAAFAERERRFELEDAAAAAAAAAAAEPEGRDSFEDPERRNDF